MLSDITSDQPDFTQCRHCGATLATRLLSCPSCGANQADSLDPLGWLPPKSSSATARLPAPAASIKPQLAAPAAWNTPAGAEDDRFYARHDPWGGPGRSRRLPGVVLVLLSGLALLVVAGVAYFGLRSGREVGNVAPKAVFGSVTTSQSAAVPASGVRSPGVQSSAVQTSTAQTSTQQTAATQTSTTQAAQVTNPAAAKPSTVSKPAAAPKPTTAPKPAEALAATPHHATPPAPPTAPTPATKRDIAGNQNPTRPDVQADVARNLQIARAMLQRDNLSAAESRLAAVLNVQPKNRDALGMRADLSAREQQRDAALDVARGCEYMSRWTCAWHNAGSALVIDSGSADAKRIVAEAMHEAQTERRPATAPSAEAPHEPASPPAPHH
jgi:hypothetical protein